MGRRDREQVRDRGNSDVVKDERGRGKDVGRAPYSPTRDKAEGDRDKVQDQPGAETAEEFEGADEELDENRRRAARADRGVQPVQRHSVGLNNPSTTGGKIGRAADRRDDSGDPENP
jgi:hypothetical protein